MQIRDADQVFMHPTETTAPRYTAEAGIYKLLWFSHFMAEQRRVITLLEVLSGGGTRRGGLVSTLHFMVSFSGDDKSNTDLSRIVSEQAPRKRV